MNVPPEQGLFDDGEYITRPTYILPELLGKEPNQFVNAARWIVMEVSADEAYYPTFSEIGISCPEYAESTNFEKHFSHWERTTATRSIIEGYIAGFPRLNLEDGTKIDTLHYWVNNSDVLGETLAVPLDCVKGLVIYSKLRTRLEMDLDEQAMDADSVFEVPLLREKKTGEMIFRTADTDDIARVIDEMDEVPTCVPGVAPPSNISRYSLTSPAKAKTLLD